MHINLIQRHVQNLERTANIILCGRLCLLRRMGLQIVEQEAVTLCSIYTNYNHNFTLAVLHT